MIRTTIWVRYSRSKSEIYLFADVYKKDFPCKKGMNLKFQYQICIF